MGKGPTRCVFGSARKATATPKLPLLWLWSSSKNCTSPRVASLSPVEHHWLMELVTDQREWSPATCSSYRPLINGRSVLEMAGRPKLPAESDFDSSKGQNIAWQCISSNVSTHHPPYHIHDSMEDGSRYSDHQSRISMRDGPRNQVCISIWNAMHIIKQRGSTSIILNSRGEVCM